MTIFGEAGFVCVFVVGVLMLGIVEFRLVWVPDARR